MQMLDNVVVLEEEYALKILTGTKTIEVRTKPPPTYRSGIYGLAIKGFPDVVVGRVRVMDWSEKMTLSDINSLQSRSKIPTTQLATYLGKKGDGGYCWYLVAPCAFETPVRYYSKGQCTKKPPRRNNQPAVETAILNAPGAHRPTESYLSSLWRGWKADQQTQQGKRRRRLEKEAIFKTNGDTLKADRNTNTRKRSSTSMSSTRGGTSQSYTRALRNGNRA